MILKCSMWSMQSFSNQVWLPFESKYLTLLDWDYDSIRVRTGVATAAPGSWQSFPILDRERVPWRYPVDPKWASGLKAQVHDDLSRSSMLAACGAGAMSHVKVAPKKTALTSGFTISIYSEVTEMFSHHQSTHWPCLLQSANVVISSNCSHVCIFKLV